MRDRGVEAGASYDDGDARVERKMSRGARRVRKEGKEEESEKITVGRGFNWRLLLIWSAGV